MDDCISRQWLMECVNEGWIKFDTEKDKNKYIHLVRDIAPSAQPFATDINVGTTDTISRADAVDLVEEVENKRLKGEIDLTYAPMINGLKALPSVTPKQRWIPCSECEKRCVKWENSKT